MNLKLQQKKELKEVEVTINYPRMDDRLQQMVRSIRQYEHVLEATAGGKHCYVSLNEVLYIDYVDGRTFLYTKEKVYESSQSLSVLEAKVGTTSMVRIGKSTLMNTAYLKAVSPYPNHRLLAEMSNGEKLIVSRKYIPLLRERVRRRERWSES